MSSAVTKKGDQAVAQAGQGQAVMESKEQSASASANAGVNLNIAGAISGLFSGKSKKETAADGSSTEEREEQAAVKGSGVGNLSAIGSANAEQKARQTRAAIQEQDQSIMKS